MFSYGANNRLALDRDPVTQLVGLNGHGKSSIPLILEELLFNRNSKGVKKGDIVNRSLNTNKYKGSIKFQVNEDEYLLEINRTGATQKVKLSKNGSDISSHTATDTFKKVEQLIFGMDGKTFSQIFYQNNATSLQFLTATDTNRKKFLIDLLNLDKYVKIFEALKDAHKKAADTLLVLETKRSTIESWFKDNSVLPKVQNLLEEPEPLVDEPIRLDRLKQQLETIESMNKKITQNNQYIQIRDSIILDPIIKDKQSISTTPMLQEIGRQKGEITRLQGLIKKYTLINGNSTCPTCEQEIDASRVRSIIQGYQGEIKPLEDSYALITAQLEKANKVNKEISDHQALVLKFEKYSALIDNSLPNMIQDRDEIEADCIRLSLMVKTRLKEISDIRALNDKANATNTKIAVIEGQLVGFKVGLDKILSALVEVKDEVTELEVLKKAFSTNGLLAYKLENSVKDLEALTNDYLTELSDGRFQLNFVVSNDKLNVVIVDNGAEIDISALSSGELSRVTTSTLLAIRKLMASLSKSRINILFLDETIDTLDTFGKERLVEVLMAEDNLNTFMISHGYSHPLIPRINVVKEDGVSRLEE